MRLRTSENPQMAGWPARQTKGSSANKSHQYLVGSRRLWIAELGKGFCMRCATNGLAANGASFYITQQMRHWHRSPYLSVASRRQHVRCLLLTSFPSSISFTSFMMGMALAGAACFSLLHEHHRFATDHVPPVYWSRPRGRRARPNWARRIAWD